MPNNVARMRGTAHLAICLLNLVVPIAHSLPSEESGPDASGLPETTPPVATCEARTINYITHTLPQYCLTTAWASSTSITTAGSERNESSSEQQRSPSSTAPIVPSPTDDDAAGEAASTPFMSFEDWKEMMLRQTGQDPQDLQHRRPNQPRADDRSGLDVGHADLGEEDEILLNFDGYLNDVDEHPKPVVSQAIETADQDEVDPTVMYEDGRASVHRSKDAGKTCKERFSYSSFDAGATVLKASPGAKNAKAILVENKDSYMLLECSSKSKFVIVELSDDILIDTIVLANFEFFSSMIRLFRVSVSDRYPVKGDRWRELGQFEARNSRDIQPFLVENPQIWAKYVRIEFLSQYGNEYYCPVSLLRVHGSRMLDSWKESESGRDEEGHAETDEELIEATRETPKEVESGTSEDKLTQVEAAKVEQVSTLALQCGIQVASELFWVSTPTCPVQESIPTQTTDSATNFAHNPSDEMNQATSPSSAAAQHSQQASIRLKDGSSVTATASPNNTQSSPSASASAHTAVPSQSSGPVSSAIANSTGGSMPASASSNFKHEASVVNRGSSQNSSSGKNRTSSTASSSPASPTVQESFFKSVTKRLQQVESNLTLSLQYVEDQARNMQDTLQRSEHKQISKVSVFLETLNQTVLADLRAIRGQYDELWQSTVIALESQRDQSEREIVALSARLNLLADEVIFQKRMAIVQAVLLLSCLLLVIFSRGVAIPSLGPMLDQSSETLLGNAPNHRHLPSSTYVPGSQANISCEALSREQPTDDYFPIPPPLSREATLENNVHYGQLLASHPSPAAPKCRRLSPPLTPPPVLTSTDLSQDSSHDNLSASSRPAQQSSARKPLPALPENPSSP